MTTAAISLCGPHRDVAAPLHPQPITTVFAAHRVSTPAHPSAAKRNSSNYAVRVGPAHHRQSMFNVQSYRAQTSSRVKAS